MDANRKDEERKVAEEIISKLVNFAGDDLTRTLGILEAVKLAFYSARRRDEEKREGSGLKWPDGGEFDYTP